MGKWRRRVIVAAAAAFTYHRATYGVPPPFTQTDLLETGAGRGRAADGIFDVGVIGGGIVGMAVARELRRRYPEKSIVVLEKEAAVAAHQSSHNSGVIHAGIYYEPGTTMARLCVRGARLMYEYCEQHGLPVNRCGKLIVATGIRDQQTVKQLYERGVANGVEGLRLLSKADEIAEIEPNVLGTAALWSPNTGVVDFAEVTRSFLRDLERSSGGGRFQLQTRFEVRDLTTVVVGSSRSGKDETLVAIRGVEPGQAGPLRTVLARNVVSCAGLNMGEVAALAGGAVNPQTLSFRGSYYQLRPEARGLIKGANVYPCPTPSGGIPVGVHFTPTVGPTRGDGNIIVGPTSAFCTHREGYSALDLDLGYLAKALSSLSFVRFLMSYSGLAVKQLRDDLEFDRFYEEARRLVPTLRREDLEPSFSGVMAQVFTADGTPMRDFAFEALRPPPPVQLSPLDHIYFALTGVRPKPAPATQPPSSPQQEQQQTQMSEDPLVLCLRNAPSPAATASLAIAEEVAERAAAAFKWSAAQQPQQPPVEVAPATYAEDPADASDAAVRAKEHIPPPAAPETTETTP